MRKWIYHLFLVMIVLVNIVVPVSAEGNNSVEINGDSAIVIDVETGDVLYGKNQHKKQYPASITKIMTALITLERSDLDEKVTYSKEALYSIESGSSAAYIKPGEIMTVEESLYVMMLHSANDVAHGLAYYVGGDLEQFADLMNRKAKQLGCQSTHFVNASGLHDDDHYTTADDMAKIARAAYENVILRKIMRTVEYDLAPTNMYDSTRSWVNGNRMIRSSSEYYYEPCLGGKTGYTTTAGGTLVTYAHLHDRVLACVVLKSQNSATAYVDSTNLYKYVDKNVDFSVYEKKKETTEKITATTEKNSDEEIVYEVENTTLEKVIFGVKIAVGVLVVLCLAVILRIIYVQNVKRKRRIQKRKRRQQQMRKRRR